MKYKILLLLFKRDLIRTFMNSINPFIHSIKEFYPSQSPPQHSNPPSTNTAQETHSSCASSSSASVSSTSLSSSFSSLAMSATENLRDEIHEPQKIDTIRNFEFYYIDFEMCKELSANFLKHNYHFIVFDVLEFESACLTHIKPSININDGNPCISFSNTEYSTNLQELRVFLAQNHKRIYQITDSDQINPSFFALHMQNIRSKLSTIIEFDNSLTVSMVDTLAKNPIFQNFKYLSKFSHERRDQLLSQFKLYEQFPYLICMSKDILKFVWDIKRSLYHKKIPWSSYGRYTHKFEIGGLHAPKCPAYLIFTQASEADCISVLIKSNTCIQNPAHHKFYTNGSRKDIKLYALILRFQIHTIENWGYTVVPHPSRFVEHVVTCSSAFFARQHSSHTAQKNPIAIQKKDPTAKSLAMYDILLDRRLGVDFVNWGVLDFTTFNHHTHSEQVKVLAFQKFLGKDVVTILLNQPEFFVPTEKVRLILSLINHLSNIICTEYIWPHDIKFENICCVPRVDGSIAELAFIDYHDNQMTVSFLKRSSRESYTHPVPEIDSMTIEKFAYIVDKFDQGKRLLNDVDWQNSHEFKLITYHLCFELYLVIFEILYWDAFEVRVSKYYLQDFLSMFNLKSSLIPLDQLQSFFGQHTNNLLNSIPFQKLVKYVYRQNFNLTIHEIFSIFFIDIKETLFNYLLGDGYLKSKKIKVPFPPRGLIVEAITALQSDSPEIQQNPEMILSNAWIERIVFAFCNMPNMVQTRKKTATIEKLETI